MSLSELEQRIVAELEEFHYENVPTLMNTLFEGSRTDDALRDFQAAVDNLVVVGQVWFQTAQQRKQLQKMLAVEVGLAAVRELSSFIYYNEERQCWTDRRRTGPSYSDVLDEVRLTPEGLVTARAILDDRGYQWWRTPKA